MRIAHPPRWRPTKAIAPRASLKFANGKLRILKKPLRISGFGASWRSRLRRLDEQNTHYMTLLTFDPTLQQITTKIVYGGETGERAPIDLK